MSDKYFENNRDKDLDDGIVELAGDDGNLVRFYHIGTIDFENEWFVFFQPAEPKDGVDPDEVVIFKLEGDERNETLVPVTDDEILEKVYAKFVEENDD